MPDNCQFDKDWLITTLSKINRRPSISEIESFTERVAVVLADSADTEDNVSLARGVAYRCVFVDSAL